MSAAERSTNETHTSMISLEMSSPRLSSASPPSLIDKFLAKLATPSFQQTCLTSSSYLLVLVFAGVYNGHYGTTYWWLFLLFCWMRRFGDYSPFKDEAPSTHRQSTEKQNNLLSEVARKHNLLLCLKMVFSSIVFAIVTVTSERAIVPSNEERSDGY